MTDAFSDKIEPKEPSNTKDAAIEYKLIIDDLNHIYKKTSIVEYGCGYGAFAIDGIKWNLSQSVIENKYIEYIGVDIDRDYLEVAKRQAEICGFDGNILLEKPKFIHVQGTDLEIGMNTADIVFLVHTLHDITQIKYLTETFYNIFRILKADGKLIILDKSTRTDSDEFRYILWDKEDFILLLKDLTDFELKLFPNYSTKYNRFEIFIKIIKKSEKTVDYNQLLLTFISFFQKLEKKYGDLVNLLEDRLLEDGYKDAKLEKIYKDILFTVSEELKKYTELIGDNLTFTQKHTSPCINFAPRPSGGSSVIAAIERISPKQDFSPKDAPLPARLAPLFGVPNLPARYMERDDYLDQFRDALLLEEAQTVGITGRPEYIGVQGMGGLGKSVLAAALACDVQVRRAFPDGIFWLRFGKEIDDDGLLELQKEILLVFDPDSQPESPAQGRNLLNLALQSKRCLYIADDLWDSCHLNFFDIADSDCRFLITTRDAKVIEGAGAHLCELHLLSDKQARELLAKYSGIDEEALPEEAEAILRECKRLPLAIAAIGSMVNGKGRNRWKLALDKLQNARLDKIPAKFDRYSSYENLFKVFQVSVEDLPPEVRAYFKTLLVFPEDVEIPESVLQFYWKYIGQGDYEPLDAVDMLVQRSLLSPAEKESFTLHDLLRDYLVFESGGMVAELHKHLLEAYKVAYPNGWHTIPCEEPYYFQKYWSVHVDASGEITQAYAIADALIHQQPLLNRIGVREALKFTDYELVDIAPSLLKTNQNPNVVADCLKILGIEAKEDARRLLKESQNSFVIATCLKILGGEAKEDARWLLKESQNSFVIAPCLKILGGEAKEDARRLLKESQDSYVIATCLTILGDEANEDARRLLKESKDSFVVAQCLKILGGEAKEDARRLLKESQDSYVITTCLTFLRYGAKEDARRLLKESKDASVVAQCLKILGGEAKEDARRLLKESKDASVIANCLTILGYEAKEDARRLLKESNDASVIANCFNILGYEAKEDARRLLKESNDASVIVTCFTILGDEAKEDARRIIKKTLDQNIIKVCIKILGEEASDDAKRLLKGSDNEQILVSCLYLLGDEAKKEARQLLKTAKYEGLLVTCISILGKEAKADAIRLSKTGKHRLTRKNCEELICSWESSLGSKFPELSQLEKTSLENKEERKTGF